MGRTMCIALDLGRAAVCVVTSATRDLLERQLLDRGIDVEAVLRSGQYVPLDAVDTLDEIAPDGAYPDQERFNALIGDVVEHLAAVYPGVWMYGELAGLMWVRGNQAGAIQLEKMWTSFADTHPVCLCVAFPLQALSYPIVVEAVQEVVAQQIRSLAKDSALALAVRHGPPIGRSPKQ